MKLADANVKSAQAAVGDDMLLLGRDVAASKRMAEFMRGKMEAMVAARLGPDAVKKRPETQGAADLRAQMSGLGVSRRRQMPRSPQELVDMSRTAAGIRPGSIRGAEDGGM